MADRTPQPSTSGAAKAEDRYSVAYKKALAEYEPSDFIDPDVFEDIAGYFYTEGYFAGCHARQEEINQLRRHDAPAVPTDA